MHTLFTAAAVGGGLKTQELQFPTEAIVPADLASFDETVEAKHLARLEADNELVLQLALRNYEGPEWIKFSTALAQYGFQIVRAWVLSGAVFVKCAEKGIGLASKNLRRDKDAATELSAETVAEGIHAFRNKVLCAKQWDHTRGATLKTFFIGQCIYQFPNVYRRWISEQDIRPLDVDRDSFAIELNASATQQIHPDRLVDLKRTLMGLRQDDPRAIQAMREMGYTNAEIADVLNTTVRAIESKLYRFCNGGAR